MIYHRDLCLNLIIYQQITTNVISAAWQFLSALCVCKVHKGSVTDSTQKRAHRLCKINAPLAKLNHPCKWPLNEVVDCYHMTVDTLHIILVKVHP